MRATFFASPTAAALSRRGLFRSFTAACLLAAGLSGCGGGDAEERPYAAWTGALSDLEQSIAGFPAPVVDTFKDQTVRHVMRVSLGGDRWRIRVSNLFGKQPVTFTGVHLARSTGQSNIEAGSSQAVTFGGQGAVTLAPGAEAQSDPVALMVAPLGSVTVSLYFAGPTPMPTVHGQALQVTYVGAGNQLTAASIPAAAADQRESYYGVSLVENLSTEPARVLVAFGDSITDGAASTVGANKRYPNLLDDRIKAAGMARTSVVNQGIGGNRWLNDVLGPSGNSRFERDVLGVPGVTHTLILMGINDIGFSVFVPQQEVSADQITAAMAGAVTKAKARGLKVLLGTLLPYKGAAYYSDPGEAKRQALNTWIRSNRDIDGVVDFDRAMQDPADPLLLKPAYDSGDHLHPNDAGYAAMAAAVDLTKL